MNNREELNHSLLPGQVVPGTRYRILSLIGEGGMGSVYLVEHLELQKRFVLKSLLRELSEREDLVLRLRNEWRALARLDHPNIVRVSDAGTTEQGIPYYVMEFLEGETLAVRLRRERRLPAREACEVTLGVLRALSAAHAIPVVHRDVKPPNVFLPTLGPVKLLDFGIAKICTGAKITAKGVAIGTPRYMSPEQIYGHSVDCRADLYAAGLLLFEMLVGRGPFDTERDGNQVLLAHLSEEPARLDSLRRELPPELSSLVVSLLKKQPNDRPGSAAEVIVVLERVIDALRGASVEAQNVVHKETISVGGIGEPEGRCGEAPNDSSAHATLPERPRFFEGSYVEMTRLDRRSQLFFAEPASRFDVAVGESPTCAELPRMSAEPSYEFDVNEAAEPTELLLARVVSGSVDTEYDRLAPTRTVHELEINTLRNQSGVRQSARELGALTEEGVAEPGPPERGLTHTSELGSQLKRRVGVGLIACGLGMALTTLGVGLWHSGVAGASPSGLEQVELVEQAMSARAQFEGEPSFALGGALLTERLIEVEQKVEGAHEASLGAEPAAPLRAPSLAPELLAGLGVASESEPTPEKTTEMPSPTETSLKNGQLGGVAEQRKPLERRKAALMRPVQAQKASQRTPESSPDKKAGRGAAELRVSSGL